MCTSKDVCRCGHGMEEHRERGAECLFIKDIVGNVAEVKVGFPKKTRQQMCNCDHYRVEAKSIEQVNVLT